MMTDYITSYMVNFNPDGHMVLKYKNVTDEIDDKGGGKIIFRINFLVQPLVENTEESSEKKNISVIARDNYFNLPKVMEILRDFMVGVLHTSRFCPGRPGKNVKEMDNSQINSNQIFWSVDPFGTSIIRWTNNARLFLVTTVHNGMDEKNVLGGDQY